MEYYGIMPKRYIWIKIGIIIFGIYNLYIAIINYNLFQLLLGIILIFATFSERKHIVSESGIDILYIVCGIKFYNLWKWREITTLHIDLITSDPYGELHIGKDIVARRFILTKKDITEVLKLAKIMNSKIYISNIKKGI